ncbi:MAG: nucleolar 10-like [Trebouxia sp. A1-2]|nr:MAG: nucleolar 10-like [Trebouxia sp. A1-2]
MKVSAPDGVKVYNVSSGRSLPAWLSEKKKRSLRKDEEYRRQVELVQDLEFPAACHRLKATPDGQYLFATGIHAPRLRVYELSQLSMKFERHFDAEIVDFQILSDDYSKAAFLCEDRSIHFHAKFGQHYSTRVPSFGRDLAYAPFSADLLVVGSAPEVYRLNLAEGRFLSPLPAKSPGINACGISSVHGLFGCAGDDGVLECFDLRKRTSIGTLNAAAAAGAADAELTAVRFDDTGLHCAVGTSNGLVALYDLRSSRPLLVKDHMYGDKVTDIKFHAAHGSGGRKIVSSDSHIVKIWDQHSGVSFTNIEPAEGSINDVCLWKDSGLAMLACDAPKIQAYFVPSLGPAPKWCSFLEGLTEELEESAAPAVYDDYRFVTKAEVDRLGLNHLIGTSLMRAYMHGYFVDNRLWHKARALAEPFAYDTYRQQRVQQKMEQDRKSRIGIVKKLPKVNKKMAAQAMLQQAAEEAAPAETSNKKRKVLPSVLEDDRFKAMPYKQTTFDRLLQWKKKKGKKRKASSQSQPRMYVAKDESAAAAFNQGRSLQGLQEVPLGQRAPSSSNPSSAVTAR